MSITLTLTVDSAELAKQLVDLAAGTFSPAPKPVAASPQQPVAPVSAPVYPVPMPAPVAAPPAAPTAPPPTYAFDDLARAASTLMDAGKQQELVGLLGSFGVQALTQLPKERYGEFATALRGLGAQI